MGVFKFLISKTFFKHLGIAVLVTGVILIVVFQWLKVTTNHNEYIEVPNLKKLELSIVQQKLQNMNLRFEVLDSASFDPEYKPLSIIEHVPKAGKKVKENRKIYLTINPSLRQVRPNLIALGFEIGEITKEPNMAKDVVLKMKHKGKEVKAGDKLKKTSKIDLVVGDGSLKYLE